MGRAWILAAALLGAWFVPQAAHAQLSVGGHIGYGVGLNSTPDPYRGLFGVRSGWNFDDVYLGGQVSFYTGEKVSSPLGADTSRQLQVLGIDAGYDIDLSALYLRPIFGLGGTVGLRQVGGQSRNEGAAFLNFGAEVLSKLIKNRVFFGGGLRITSTFFKPDNINAFSFYVVAGTRFDFSGDGKGIPLRSGGEPGGSKGEAEKDERKAKEPRKKPSADAPRPEDETDVSLPPL